MTKISGPLNLVTERETDVVEVWIRAPEPRPHNDGLIIDTTDRIEVTDGQLSFTCAPGPAILIVVSLVATGRLPSSQVPETRAVPILVPAAESVTLADVVNAATVSSLGQSLVEELAVRVANDLAAAQAAQAEARESATSAGQSATKAAGHAKRTAEDRQKTTQDAQATETGKSEAQSAAAAAAKSAGQASTAAEAALEDRRGAEAARTGAESAASIAADGVRAEVSEHATAAAAAAENAATSAETASAEADRSKSEADRAEVAAQSASTGVEVDTVGKSHLTPELRGEIDGKVGTGHRHTMVDVAGLDSALAGKATKADVTAAVAALVDGAPAALDTLGEIATELNENESERAAITNTLAGKADTVRVDARPATWLWDGVEPWIPPDAAVAGDVVLDLSTGAITTAVLP